MSLQTTPVSQCLEKKLTIAGYEVPDLLAIFSVLSVLNFLFGSFRGMKLWLVWLPTLAVAAVLRIGKRGKPDNYLVHLIKHRLSPKYYPAFSNELTAKVPPYRADKTRG